MRHASQRRYAAACAFAATALLASPTGARAQEPAAPDSARTVASGVFSTEQAAQGESTFRTVCGNCHATSQFNGPAFRKVWSGRTVYDLFDQLRNTMPLDNPGGLTPADYVGVIAYLLRLNEYPAGKHPLPTTDAELRRLRF